VRALLQHRNVPQVTQQMAWRTCVPFLPRSAREYARELGKRGVVMDPNFCESVWDLLDAQADAQRVHVAEPRFSEKGVNEKLG
jgi:hypothetical protein